MSIVAPAVRGAQPAPTPPVRHGLCRLTLTIDGSDYRLTRSPAARAEWRLKKKTEPRAGQVYRVHTHKRVVSCTCLDHYYTGITCKHIRALQALGLVSRRAKPEAVAETKGGRDA